MTHLQTIYDDLPHQKLVMFQFATLKPEKTEDQYDARKIDHLDWT